MRIALTALTLLVLSAGQHRVHAIEDLQLQIQGTNAVLSWPSTQNETFIVRYRARLDEAHPWTILTNGYPAAWGGNRTLFTHVGVVEYPAGGGGGGGGGGNPPSPEGASSGQNDSDTEKIEWPPLPPAPWDPRWIRDPSEGDGGLTEDGGGEVPLGAIGFYQVVREGIHFVGLPQNALLSGSVALFIEVGVHPSGALDGVYIENNGEPINGLHFQDRPDGIIQAVWNTAQAPNGLYTLQLGAQLDGSVHISGSSVVVEVFNAIRFPNAWPVAGDAMWIDAQTIHANGTWTMQFYDENDNWLGELAGVVDGDGYCNVPGIQGPGFSLSLLDDNDEQLPFESIKTEVTTYAAAGSGQTPPQASAQIRTVVERRWWRGFPTYYNVAYMQIYNPSSHNGINLRFMVGNVVGAAQSRYPHDPNAVARGTMENPFALIGANDWVTLQGVDLRGADGHNRNLYYFGHGGPNSIGTGSINTRIRVEDLKFVLRNAPDPLVGTNRYPYRFVFLDGCKTAEGDFPPAFGIPKGRITANDFILKRGIRPRAFLGWNKNVTISWGAFDQQHNTFIGSFFDKWANSIDDEGKRLGLDQAIQAANPSQWNQKPSLVIHGAVDLRFLDDL